jgi:hypothetical protein
MANGFGAYPSWATVTDVSAGAPQMSMGNFPDPSAYGELSPIDQYQRFLGGLTPAQGRPAGGWGAPLQRARMNMFSPLYGQYEAFGFGQGPETFGDYLAGTAGPGGVQGGANPTYADLAARAQALAYATPDERAIDPSMRPFYGGGGEGFDPQGAQRRLINQLSLGQMGGSQYNQRVQSAVEGAINQMYQNYLGTSAQGATGPEGFLKYYMQQRYPGSMTPAAA